MSKVHRAAEIYKRRGLYELLLAIREYLKYRSEPIKNEVRGIKSVILSDGYFTHDIGGSDVTVPMKTSWQRHRFGTIHNEHKFLEEIMHELKQDDVFYDVGAYLGWHTLTARAAMEQGSVIAFEPHPVSYDRLCEVINQVSQEGIQVYNVGLSNSHNTVPMSGSAGSGSQIHPEGESKEELISINTVIGDEFITEENIPQPTVLKIDVEGWEVAAIEGLTNAINRQECRVVYCEIHPHKAPEEDNVKNIVTNSLNDAGFRIRTIPHEDSKSILKAEKR